MTLLALETEALCMRYGALTVVDSVDLRIKPGERHAIIGPNGAGKSTLMDLLTGTLIPSSGRILMDGVRIDTLRSEERMARGMGRSFQTSMLFPQFSPLESICLVLARKSGRLWNPLQRLYRQTDIIDEAFELASSVGLRQDFLRATTELSYGRQRLLDIALVLASKPKILLLDEPTAGVAVAECFEILKIIEDLPREVTVLFSDHNMDLVFRFAQRITLLVAGSITRQGSPSEMASDPEVSRIYLGTKLHV